MGEEEVLRKGLKKEDSGCDEGGGSKVREGLTVKG